MHKREESADAASIGVFMIDAKGVAASLQIGESSAKSARSPRPGWGGEEWRLIGCLILNVFFKNFQGSSAY